MNNYLRKLLIAIFFVCVTVCAFAQTGAYNSYSPFSVYGVGDVLKEGNAYTRTMGGVGVANRNKRFINYMNPAAVTARDSLAFMADFGLQENNKVFTQTVGDTKYKSANNTFNIANFVMSFPIYKSSAFMVGISPYSDIGYDFSSVETRQDLIGNTNNISYQSYGNGGIYQLFVGAGVTFWKRLSLGAEFIYYFGTMNKTTNTVFSDASYRSINAGYETRVRTCTGKFGLQYEQKLWGNISMIAGATYKPSTLLKGEMNDYSFAVSSELSDTLKYNPVSLKDANLRLSDEIGVGLTIKGGDQWSAEFDYLRSDWRNCGFDDCDGFKVFSTPTHKLYSSSVSNSFRAGFEFVPNRNDIRYYHKRMAYRAGVYHEQEKFMIEDNRISTTGITLGVTLPVFRWYNGLSLGVDFGQRGSTKGSGVVREHYATILVGFNIHDVWFQKPKYN